jgi:hypothetical protein
MKGGEAGLADAHPSADELVDFAEERTPAAHDAAIEAHLAGCSTCRDVVADLRAYPDLEPPGPEFRVGPDEVRARLADLRAALGPSEPPGVSPAPVARRPARWLGAPRPLLAWAAVAVVAFGAALYLWLQVLELRREFRTVGSPRPNVAIAALLPDDDPLRSAEGPALAIGSGLALAVADDDPFPAGSYRAEILGRDGTVALALEGLEPDAAGGLTFYLPPGALAAGDYRVALHRAGAGAWPRRFTLRIAS